MKELAEEIVPRDFYHCFVQDDSVQYWKGITLPHDPEPLFGMAATDKPQHKTDKSVSLWKLLEFFQDDGFNDRDKFVVVGFYKLNAQAHTRNYGLKSAFNRRHPTSAVILNLDKLKGGLALIFLRVNNSVCRCAISKGRVCNGRS